MSTANKRESLIDLNKLTVKYLEEIAKECGISLNKSSKKSEKIRTITSAGISEEKLKELYEIFLSKYESTKKPTKRIESQSNSLITSLENKINLLEQQVKYLMSKMDGVENKSDEIKGFKPSEKKGDLRDIEEIIISKIPQGASMAIDELIQIKALQEFSMKLIEQAIIELINDNIFNVLEGPSTQKIKGNIGRLVRK
ncbi:MAG TPA: hypothetical protein VGB37_16845 [Candidatus Lokiarchaeia archaeon]